PGAAGAAWAGPSGPVGPGPDVNTTTCCPPPPEPARGIVVAEIPPMPEFAPLPAYPDFAREAGIEGRVIVRVLVGTDGLPKQVVAVSGSKALIQAAVDAV